MKIQVLLATLIATNLNISAAFAAEKTEVIKATALLRVYPVTCITRVRENKTYTKVGDQAAFSSVTPEGAIELNHENVIANGCDLEKLKIIADRAEMFFGFIHDAPVTVTKSTGESYKYNGKCFANYREDVVADIGEGILVSSMEIERRPATDCAN